MDNRQAVNTLGLSPAELGAINQQQIMRDQNVINMLGKQSTMDRNKSLNRLTEAQTREYEPASFEYGDQTYQTTRGNLHKAMKDVQIGMKNQTDMERMKLDNTPKTITVEGEYYTMPQYQVNEFYQNLANQEKAKQASAKGEREQVDADLRDRALLRLGEGEKLTGDIALEGGAFPQWVAAQGRGTATGEAKAKTDLAYQKQWATLYTTLGENLKNPLALAESANKIAERLNSNTAVVVFTEGHVFPGWKSNISKGHYKLTNMKTPNGKKLSISDIRKAAKANNMTLNEALKIIYINQEKAKE